MKNNVNNQRFKTIQNYSSIMKKQTPISILTAENTIFIKTNQNKLTSNYLRNGKQIKQKKHFLSTTINQIQKSNNSLKNTFSLRKSNLITKLDKNNLNDINNKLNEILKNKKIKGNHFKGTNSFIKMDRRNKKNNLSSINGINGISNDNHNYNFNKTKTNINNSSIKEKYKIQNKQIKDIDIQNINFTENENDKNNNFNSTYTIGIKKSTLKPNNKSKKSSISKKSDINMNKTTFFKKINYSNNLSNLIKSSNHDNIYFRTLNGYMDKGKEYYNRINNKLYYPRRMNNKYIYSMEKKKEKSLAEKRQRAKKPISYLIKNNYLNIKDNPQNINRIVIDLNNEKNDIKKIGQKPIKRKNTTNRLTNYKKNIYNIDNYNYITNIENEEKNKNRNALDMKTIDFNNDNYIKTSPNFDEEKIKLKINKEISTSKNSNENNNIVNNNYYNINNTFIFDANGNKLYQYDLTKLITQNSKDSENLNHNLVHNYNTNNFNTIDTDMEMRNRNNIIKNINKNIKIETKPEYKVKNITKNKKLNYYKIELDNKINNNNKLNTNINKVSNLALSNLIKKKIEQNYLQFLSIENKNHIQNILKKGIIKGNNNNKNIINKNSKNLGKIKFKNIKDNKQKEVNNIINKYKTLNIKNSFDLNNNIDIKKKFNHISINEPKIIRKKSNNVGQILKNLNINNINNDFFDLSLNNRKNNSIKNKNNNTKKEKKDTKVLKMVKNNNLRENKIISYKILNNKNKNKSYNIEKLNKLSIKLNDLVEKQQNKNSNLYNIKPKENEIYFNENVSNIDDKYSINTYEVEEEIEENDDDNNKKKNQNSSFELISLDENNSNENTKEKNEKDEDNFDDINSIIKKIDFNENENMNIDIFSLNNDKYKEFHNIFDKKFEQYFTK